MARTKRTRIRVPRVPKFAVDPVAIPAYRSDTEQVLEKLQQLAPAFAHLYDQYAARFLRDQFALAALNAVKSAGYLEPELMADRCYVVADAFLERRKAARRG